MSLLCRLFGHNFPEPIKTDNAEPISREICFETTLRCQRKGCDGIIKVDVPHDFRYSDEDQWKSVPGAPMETIKASPQVYTQGLFIIPETCTICGMTIEVEELAVLRW